MKTAAIALLLAVTTWTAGQSAVSSELASMADGAYYKVSDRLAAMELAPMATMEIKNKGSVLVPFGGFAMKAVHTFRGATSPLQLRDSRPVFYVKQDPILDTIPLRTRRDLLIVPLDRRKETREIKIVANLKKLPSVSSTSIAAGMFEIRPEKALPPGEYLLTFSPVSGIGYDFTIKK